MWWSWEWQLHQQSSELCRVPRWTHKGDDRGGSLVFMQAFYLEKLKEASHALWSKTQRQDYSSPLDLTLYLWQRGSTLFSSPYYSPRASTWNDPIYKVSRGQWYCVIPLVAWTSEMDGIFLSHVFHELWAGRTNDSCPSNSRGNQRFAEWASHCAGETLSLSAPAEWRFYHRQITCFVINFLSAGWIEPSIALPFITGLIHGVPKKNTLDFQC